MPDLPLVTVITPSFNQADFLEETIQSVLSQDYPNLEYFIFDGGSTDGSVDIIQKYSHRLAGWVSEKDKGQAEAINKGFARAAGSVVAWINSDDYYLPGAISAAVAALEASPTAALVFGDVVSVDAASKIFNVMTYGPWGLDELLQFNIIGQPGVFMRRAALERAGYLDSSYHFMLDHHLWLRIAQQAPLIYVPQRWAAARYHAAAKNVSQAPGFAREAYRIVDWMPSQPGLAQHYQRLRRRIWAGAHRINGHYLLDAGQPGPALKAYIKGLWSSPAVILPEYRRILFAVASLFINVNRLRAAYLERRRRNYAR
ncbi:MAG: glycosyltransferase [Anaerolineaceae bacterium]|nr:glycosyltransferase [Anaerolineaceae bacterium]